MGDEFSSPIILNRNGQFEGKGKRECCSGQAQYPEQTRQAAVQFEQWRYIYIKGCNYCSGEKGEKEMTKLLTRLFIMFTAIYIVVVCILALFGFVFFSDIYILLAELDICLVCSSQGKYHCRYMKYLAWGIFLSDTLTRADGEWDFLPVGASCVIPAAIIVSSMIWAVFMAIRHYVRIQKLKR